MRWLAVVFVFGVLVFTAVSLVSGGTLTGERVGGGYVARWSTGCSALGTGPHQCLSGRADNSAMYCREDSTGNTVMRHNCNECDCNTFTGENNFNCTTATGECTLCLSVCLAGTDEYDDCAEDNLECDVVDGLCDRKYRCVCSSAEDDKCHRNGDWGSWSPVNPNVECGNALHERFRDERRCYSGSSGPCTWGTRRDTENRDAGSCDSGYYCSSNRCEPCPCSEGDLEIGCEGTRYARYRSCPSDCQWGSWVRAADCYDDEYQNECLEGETSRCVETGSNSAGCACV